jgi:aspartyl-tRNA(Asn)/glutamyl-tRNA(Gln) amidotransferase subunit C
MSLTLEDLDNLSHLARITVQEEEKEKMLTDMQAILGYVSEINEISGDVKRIRGAHYNIVREDIVTNASGTNTEAFLKEAPATEDGYVKVAQVLK